MSSVLVIGAGGVSRVTVHKMVINRDVFQKIFIASKTLSKCVKLADEINSMYNFKIEVFQLDADHIQETVNIIKKTGVKLVINLALPYQDLNIMKACLECKVDYLDTANYESKEEAKFEYKLQWQLSKKFKEANIMALLGSGFDPGVTNVFTKYIKSHLLDEIHYLDIVDCNNGKNNLPFATNFNPEINIREVSANGKFYEHGKWLITKPLSKKVSFEFPTIGRRDMYLLYHEELESLVKNFSELKRARFWMTFSNSYLNYLNVLQKIGLTSIEPIIYKKTKIIPLEFLKNLLPDPASLAPITTGQTCIGVIVTGKKNGEEYTYFVYNICYHKECYKETLSQAVSYTTGVPAMIGSKLILEKIWKKPGVWNLEQFNPDPFMELLNNNGLPHKVVRLENKLSF